MSEPIRYGSWSKDRQGWFLGLSGGTWVTIVATGVPLLLATGAHAWGIAAAWLPVWALLVILVAVPVRGRPAAAWGRDVLLRAFGTVLGWTDWQSRAAAGTVENFDEADLPGVLSGIRTHDGPPFGPLLARPVLVADSREHSWAVVARVRHPGIGLAEAGVRARVGSGLAELLEGAATGGLASRVVLQVRTVPDDGAERDAWRRRHRRADAPPLALAVEDDLSRVSHVAGVQHEAFVTVVVPEHRIARQAAEAGGGMDGRARVLYGLMVEIEQRLLGAVGCSAVHWLDSAALATAIRTGFAPGDAGMLAAATFAAQTDPSAPAALPMAAAGPTYTPSPDARSYTHDAWQTASCTVLLPDKGALMGALAPVYTPGSPGERRCVTVFFEAIPGHTAERLVGHESLSADLAADLRRRSGFQLRAVHRRDAARVDTQDQRLADGNALVRVAIAAAVTVPATWSITDYARRLEVAVTGCGFTPLRLDLAQDSGFAAACIPLGVGLPRRRGLR